MTLATGAPAAAVTSPPDPGAGAAYTAESTAAAVLATGSEAVIWDEYPSQRTIFPRVIAVLVLFVIAFVLLRLPLLPATARPNWNGRDVLSWGVVLLGALIILAMLLRNLIRLRSIRYRLSTQRIFIEYGIFNKRTDEIELEKYKDVFVNQDFWDKIVGCGDIQVITGDVTNPTVNILDVIDPIGKKESIRKAARERQAMLGLRLREQM
jgi:uncharacterized membrane protein YdbT with pleckstrin-like domain